MTQLVQPRLVNPPEGDPGVYLDFRFGRRAMLFDLGDLAALTPRELLRVSHAFVSHAHMDHVAGFDRLLRLRLHRPRPLTVIGPEGFLKQTENRLGAFTWNLLDARSVDFRLTVQEFDGRRISAAAEFRAREAFRRRDLPLPPLEPGLVLSEADFTVEAKALDHKVTSLAFALQERLRVNVWRSALDARGLPVGAWLGTAKTAIRSGAPDAQCIEIPGHGPMPLGELRRSVLKIGQGQRVAYVTDAADTGANRDRIVALSREADHLFIEATFLEADRDLATATAHLTARGAGEIARAAAVRRVTGFHHSARYGDETDMVAAELAAAARPEAARTEAPDTSGPAGEPNWLRRWRRKGLSPEAALIRFDGLPPVDTTDLIGAWRGTGLPSGHPLDGLLERLGWRGKRFESEDHVDPLVFEPELALDPAWLPLKTALRWPRLAKSRPSRIGFLLLRRALRAHGPAARLAPVCFRGCTSVAMIYDRQPITDHFRRIDVTRLIGLMQTRAAPPYFFLLTREA
ncbi:GXWXG domain-containing protein [Limimaricola cinnabarinus]|uniref:GXWXG domain-containing protein n=1 Tax=Limimaricola cinnabarinus TaxID=1125964 RepID=UPI00248FBAB5|nr:GXWXG domain-containing protein [Limimaricola cinnabarinus]